MDQVGTDSSAVQRRLGSGRRYTLMIIAASLLFAIALGTGLIHWSETPVL